MSLNRENRRPTGAIFPGPESDHVAQFDHHFSLNEAKALVPWVRSIFQRVGMILESLGAPESQSRAFSDAPGLERETDRQLYLGGPSSAAVADPEALIGSLSLARKRQLVRAMVDQVRDKGIVIQDLRRGLIDFPAWHEGREVFLCYELEDGEGISHWHELKAGYAGRRPIEEYQGE